MAFFPAVTGGLGWRGDGQFAGLRDERKLRGAPAFLQTGGADSLVLRSRALSIRHPRGPSEATTVAVKAAAPAFARQFRQGGLQSAFQSGRKRDILSGSLSAIKFFVTLLKSEIALHID